MSADLLDGGRPKRLIFRHGRWFLEMMRLVSTGDGVFQPRNTRIEGKSAIIEALRRIKNGKPLIDAATKIVSTGSVSDDASFDAIDGAWVPSRLAPSYIEQLGRADVRSPVEAALIADLTMLRASHEGLMGRVARLERLLAGKFDGELHPFSVRPERLRNGTARPATLREGLPPPDEHDEDRDGDSGGDARRDERDGHRDERDEHRDERDEHRDERDEHRDERDEHRDERDEHRDERDERRDGDVRAYDEPPAEDASERVAAATGTLEFPALGVVTDALKQLCGHDIPLKEMRNAPNPWLQSPARFHASWLVDDAGEVQGGIVCDLEGIARLGGAYLAMSQADIEAQVAADHPGEDIVSAASDICNTLCGLVNDVRGNPTVRSNPLSPFEAGPPPWIDSPGTRIVCVHPGGGTVAFLAR